MGHGFSVSSFAINTVLSTSDLLGFSEGPKREKCTYGGGGWEPCRKRGQDPVWKVTGLSYGSRTFKKQKGIENEYCQEPAQPGLPGIRLCSEQQAFLSTSY